MIRAPTKLEELEHVREPLPTTKKFVQQMMDEMTGLIESARWTSGLPGCATCSTGSPWTAARSEPWPSGRRRPTTVLTGRTQ